MVAFRQHQYLVSDLQVMLEDLGEAFQYEVLKMLKKEGKINDVIIENMLSWHHSGFNVYIGDRIEPDENLKVTRKDRTW